MSRPPSARPKTSAGRVASARQRPTTANRPPLPTSQLANGGIARPESRTASRMGMASRAGPRPTTGARAEQVTERIGTSSGVRSMLSSAARPITQQGLTGARAVSRLGTASQRQVFDKSYFVGVLKAKLASLKAEIARLHDVAQQGEKDKAELGIYEAQAEQNALTIKDLQAELSDLNTVMEKMHTNSELGDLELEAREARAKADEIAEGVEQLFHDRHQKEAQIEDLVNQIESQRRQNANVIASMDADIREQYEEKQAKAAAIIAELEKKEAALKEIEKAKMSMEQELHNSPLKQKAIELRERLSELQEKEKHLTREKESAETPEEKKVKLIEHVKKCNEDIASIQKQTQQIKEQIEMANEELREFDNEIDLRHGEQNERYLELKVTEQRMNDFLSTFEEQKRLATMDLEELAEAVVLNLARLSTNLTKVNLSDRITGIDPGLQSAEFSGASVDELKKVHVRLQEELISMAEMEENIRGEIDSMRRRISEAKGQIETFSDFAQLRKDVDNDSEALAAQEAELERAVPEAEGGQLELEAQLEKIRDELELNTTAQRLSSKFKSVADLADQTYEIRRSAQKLQEETDFEPIKQKVLELRARYNEILIAAALSTPAKAVLAG